MDEFIHLIATGGSAISTMCALACIWLVSQLRSELAEFRKEADKELKHQGERLAALEGRRYRDY